MTFLEAIQYCFRNYSRCSGDAARAARTEYWYWQLFIVLGVAATRLMEHIVLHPGPAIFSGIFCLAMALPSINVTIRRLHDLDRSGWWILVGFIPYVGQIALLMWLCFKGTVGPNTYGYDPIENERADATIISRRAASWEQPK